MKDRNSGRGVIPRSPSNLSPVSLIPSRMHDANWVPFHSAVPLKLVGTGKVKSRFGEL